MAGGDEPARSRGDDDADGVAWDDGAWVDVGRNDQWHPSIAERSRALLVLAILGGVLFLAAAVASIDDGDGEREAATADSSTTTTTEATTTTTTTTAPPDPASVDGDAPPAECVDDDRDARPLRERADSTVLVLNGTSRDGHAGENTDDLEELGYTSMPPANANYHETTEIEYLPGHCAEAVRARVDLGVPTATIAPFDEEASPDVIAGRAVLVITLGTDTT
ncbi:MAG: LytR C-terminal domain-containing protein [Acidimicrobiales bacterium]|nr:LytR C-terminal domain-containing protein [Acidimicrobiales bacterium]